MTPALALSLAVAVLIGLYFLLRRPGRRVTPQRASAPSTRSRPPSRGRVHRHRIVPDQYPGIQEALDAAAPDDSIIVRPGVYRGTVDFSGKDVSLRSEDPRDPQVVRSTILTPAEGGTAVFFAAGESERACLEGFTVTGGDGVQVRRWSVLGPVVWAGGGIFIGHGCSPTVRYNLIEGNRADLGGGIYISSSSRSLIERNIIRRNRAVLGGGLRAAGDFLRTGDDEAQWPTRGGREMLIISRCQVTDNRAHIGGGMSISRGARLLVTRSLFAENSARWDGGGIAVWDSASPVIGSSWFRANTCGSDYGFGAGVSIINNCRVRLEDNRFWRNCARGECGSGGGAVAVNRSRSILVRNRAVNNCAGMGAGIYAWAGSEVTLEDNAIASSAVQLNESARM